MKTLVHLWLHWNDLNTSPGLDLIISSLSVIKIAYFSFPLSTTHSKQHLLPIISKKSLWPFSSSKQVQKHYIYLSFAQTGVILCSVKNICDQSVEKGIGNVLKQTFGYFIHIFTSTFQPPGVNIEAEFV